MKIRLLRDCKHGKAGSVVDLDEDIAKELLKPIHGPAKNSGPNGHLSKDGKGSRVEHHEIKRAERV